MFLQTTERNRDPRQDEVEVELVRDMNTSKSKGGQPMSSNMSRRVISDAQYECGFGILPHVSRTSDAGMEEVRAEIRTLDLKFDAMQSSIELVMTKFGITVSRMTSAPSGGEQPSSDHKERSNPRKNVSPLQTLSRRSR